MKVRNFLAKWHFILLISLACLSVGGVLLISRHTYGFGFPLDDAWIHQTYARNLALRGEWAFLPGEWSAGSTSPLWTGALALGYLAGLDPRVWSYALGWGLLLGVAWLGGKWLSIRLSSLTEWAPWAALLFIFEWHLVWAALSGMEILALAEIIVLVLKIMDGTHPNAWVVGLLLGLSVWVRPDGISLLLPVGWQLLFRKRENTRTLIIWLAECIAGILLLILPYLLTNRVISGAWWPSTFYAKQAEYGALRASPLIMRAIDQLRLPIVGLGAVLLPGIVIAVLAILRQRAWGRLAPLLWILAYLGMYAIRLPVTYQHGRYAMPTIPVVIVLGMDGLLRWYKEGGISRWRWVFQRVWIVSLVIVAVWFWIIGARAYAKDVAIIETEMVTTACWISEHVEEDALVAAHDIGALGYFGEHRLLDLAGLISSDVIPILRDERALADLLDAEGVDYIMTFPEWYPDLIRKAQPVFTTDAPYSIEAGGEHMVVFRWISPGFAP
jgi:hypothetical protein